MFGIYLGHFTASRFGHCARREKPGTQTAFEKCEISKKGMGWEKKREPNWHLSSLSWEVINGVQSVPAPTGGSDCVMWNKMAARCNPTLRLAHQLVFVHSWSFFIARAHRKASLESDTEKEATFRDQRWQIRTKRSVAGVASSKTNTT